VSGLVIIYVIMRVASFGCMCGVVFLLLHLARSPHCLLGRLSDGATPENIPISTMYHITVR